MFPKENAHNFGDQFQPSQAVPFHNNGGDFASSNDKRHIAQEKAFSNNQFNKQQQQSFQNLAQSFGNNQQIYPVDCQCVPAQYCSIEDLVARVDGDVSHLLDARTQGSEILSNATEDSSVDDSDYEYGSLLTDEDYDETFDLLKNFRSTEIDEEDLATTVIPEDIEEEEISTTEATKEKVLRRRRRSESSVATDATTSATSVEKEKAPVELQGVS